MKSLFSRIVSLGFLVLQMHVIAQQQDMCKSFRLEVEIPENALHADGVVPVLVKLTNIGDKAFWMDSWSRDLIHLKLIARDAQGQTVPYSEDYRNLLDEARHAVITANVSTPITPGSAIEYPLFLDKLFELKPDGDYSLAVSRGCGSPDRQLEAETVRFSTSSSLTASKSIESKISIHLSIPETLHPSGWVVPINISVENHIDRTLQWIIAKDWNELPDEFETGLAVFDHSGKLLPPSQNSNRNGRGRRFTFDLIDIRPGESAERTVAIGNLFDIGVPGSYGAKVILSGPERNTMVESNAASFQIANPTPTPPSHPTQKPPPFVVTIKSSPADTPVSADQSSVLICMSNISDHDIQLDNACLKDFMTVEAADGTAVPMTEKANKEWDPDHYKLTLAGVVLGNTWQTVKPGGALCGGIGLGVIYDLSKPGTYRIRVDRYDEPDAVPGQKLADLPVVHSNWLTIVEGPQTPRK
jgi:hypothetical protein